MSKFLTPKQIDEIRERAEITHPDMQTLTTEFAKKDIAALCDMAKAYLKEIEARSGS